MHNKPAQLIVYYFTSLFGLVGFAVYIAWYIASPPKWWLLVGTMFVMMLASIFTAQAANSIRKDTTPFSWGANSMIRLAEFSTLSLISSFLALFVFLWFALSTGITR